MKTGPFGSNFAPPAGTTPPSPEEKGGLPYPRDTSKWWEDNVDAVRINEEISNSAEPVPCPLTPQPDDLLASDL